MKEIMINAAEEACGKTKGPPRHQETWWWNEEVESFVDRKRECYQEWYKAKERKKNEDKATSRHRRYRHFFRVMSRRYPDTG